MSRNSLLAIATLFSSIACVTGDPDAIDPNEMPALSAEDQEAVAKLDAAKLAEVEVGGGKITFFEIAPGEFFARTQAPVGAQMPALPSGASLADAFAAVAPGQAIPARMQEAIDRAATTEAGEEVAPVSAVVTAPVATDVERAAQQATPGADGVETRTSALTSVFDWTSFYNTWCKGFSGPGLAHWCLSAAGTGVNMGYKAHRFDAWMCADTGAARIRVKRSGTTLYLVDFPYGQCNGYWYHGPHGIVGQSLQRTVEYIVDYAQQSVRFAGYAIGGDQFVALPPGW
jgi:hypothetical protein